MHRILLFAAITALLCACGSTPARKPRVQTSTKTQTTARKNTTPAKETPLPAKQESDLERCIGGRTRDTYMPLCIVTDKGVLDTEKEYLPGVLACEMGTLTKRAAALEAQVIAARTFLAGFLGRRGETAQVPIGPHFQCWKAGAGPEAKAAAQNTEDLLLHRGGNLLRANYVSGTRVDAVCKPQSPKKSGYRKYKTWQAMASYWKRQRARGKKRIFKGTYWTEIHVTRNEGKTGNKVQGTLLAPEDAANRGALGQWASICLAENMGYSTMDILHYFYGDDISLSQPPPPGSYDDGELGELVIPAENPDDERGSAAGSSK